MSDKTDVFAASEFEQAAKTGAVSQTRMIFRAIFGSPVGKQIIFLVAILVAAILFNTYGQIVLNRWNKPFYDALSRRDLNDFLYQLGVWAGIVSTLLVLDVAQRWLTETTKYRLREGLTRDLLALWMVPRRAFWLATSGGPMGVNPDQRMSEDAHKLCDLSTDLSVGLFRASVLLVGFAGVLWNISNDFEIRISGVDYRVPGFMLWAAISYALIGSLLSYIVGRSLIRRNADRYSREADLRFSLVRINEHVDGIALAEGEEDERRRVEQHLGNVMTTLKRLTRGLTNLTWVTAGFGWITGIAPILVAAPLYFSGKTTFGGMMMAAAAFTQAQSSLRWFVDNFSAIADWRATLLRVANFRQALVATDMKHDFKSSITYEEGPPGMMTFDDVQVDSPVGREAFQDRNVVINAGEHVLICGAPGEGKTPLFRALAGLRPWGSGRVIRPKGEAILYVPRGTPYLPRGTLREVLAYPLETERFEETRYVQALERIGLSRLVSMLDETQRWDRDLSQDEQLALALARVVLQAPPWVLLDDTFASLDDATLERVIDIFTNDFQTTTVIHIGRAAHMHLPLFARVLHLMKISGENGNKEEAGPETARTTQ
jgi:putative ATP-binding cassette transporter